MEREAMFSHRKKLSFLDYISCYHPGSHLRERSFSPTHVHRQIMFHKYIVNEMDHESTLPTPAFEWPTTSAGKQV